MTSTSSKDFTYAMGPMKILSWPVGTWPLQKYDFFSGMRCVVSVVLLLLTLVVINTELYLDSSDSEKNLDAVVLVTCSILSIWKLVMFRVRSEGLVANFTSAVRDYNEHEGDEKRAIMRHHAYMGRVACGCVIFFSYFGSTVFTAAPMLADEEEEEEFLNATQDTVMDYPMPSEALLNMLDPPASLYPLIYVGEYLLLLMISTGNLGSDSLFFGIIFHLCGQAEVLKLDFSKFVGDTVESTSARFNVLVARHQHLLRLSRHLNKTISLVMVMQLFTSCLLICTTVHTVPERGQHRDGGENVHSGDHPADAAVRVQLHRRVHEEPIRGRRVLDLLQRLVHRAAQGVAEHRLRPDEDPRSRATESCGLLRRQHGDVHEHSENICVLPVRPTRDG